MLASDSLADVPLLTSIASPSSIAFNTFIARVDSTSTTTKTETTTKSAINTVLPSPASIISLTTTFTINDFPTSTSTPLTPSYTLFEDGSLITPIFINDFVSDKARLVVLGLLLMLFGRNVAATLSYLRRVKLKRKLLFYFLLCSQLCGPICLSALLSPFFLRKASCEIANLIAAISIEISYTLLIPCILGIKAYRCLERPRFVLITIIVIHTASLALFMSDLPNLSSSRKLTGSCTARGNLPRIVLAILLLLAEIIFICLCFVYAVWRSARYPEARGRVSLPVSMNRALSGTGEPQILERDVTFERRGWWDYVPTEKASGADPPNNAKNDIGPYHAKPGKLLAFIMILFGDRDLVEEPYFQRKPSLHTTQPISQSRIGNHVGKDRTSWLNWPRMFRLPGALKDELVYTTAIAITCALAAGIIVAGAFDSQLLGGPSMWVGLSWGLTSLLILHNFNRVVRRNEREHILQEPAAWNPLLPNSAEDPISSHSFRRSLTHPRYPPTRAPIASRARSRDVSSVTSMSSTNPFTDFDIVVPRRKMDSWDSLPRSVRRSSYSSTRSTVRLLSDEVEIGRPLGGSKDILIPRSDTKERHPGMRRPT